MIGIYKITSPKGKIYIGQSININRRWSEYLKLRRCEKQIRLYYSFLKYGPQNHKFEIIEECLENQLNERELYWGLYYNVLSKMGLNLKLGNAKGKISEKTKKKISKAVKGKSGKYKRTDAIKQLISKNTSIKIYQFTLNGEFVKEWNSITEAEFNFGKGIKDNLSKKTNKSHGFVWNYNKTFPGYNNKDHGNAVKVIQKSKNGVIIKEWNSFTQIQKELKYPTSNISACCLKKQKTAYGFIWEYKNN